MIVVNLQGRIGNQLFINAMAEAVRQKRGRDERIVFYDWDGVLKYNWKNSLEDYPLQNVEYVHDRSQLPWITRLQMFIVGKFYKKVGAYNLTKRPQYEKRYQSLFNRLGIIACMDGYIDIDTPSTKYVYIYGYFQAEKYFQDVASQIKQQYTYRLPALREKEYVQKLEERNSVCISIKVEHNAGSALYDVCNKNYYTQAIEYIKQHVENPLFFICSDNVPYVLEHFIDADKYDYLCQDKELPVSDSLTIMSACKHFIIGNTSFGWWAQYLSNNPDKIVIAPNHWYRDPKMPIEGLYNENWHLIDVSGYIASTKR